MDELTKRVTVKVGGDGTRSAGTEEGGESSRGVMLALGRLNDMRAKICGEV